MRKLYILLLSAILSIDLNAQISLTATASTTTGSYSTLKASFDAINSGTHRAIIVIIVNKVITRNTPANLNSGFGELACNPLSM